MADKPKDEKDSSAELEKLRKYLRDNGMSNQDAQALVKNRTRKENTNAIRDWLRKAGKK